MSKPLSGLLEALLKRAGLFLFPRVDDPDPETETEEELAADDESEADPEADSVDDPHPEDDPTTEEHDPPKLSARQREMIALRKRAQDAERKAEEALETARRATPRQPDQNQRLFEQEEAKLADPNTPEMERWQIQSNRTLRQSQEQSRAALAQAQDMADQTAFNQKAMLNPAYEKYRGKVEAKLKEVRAQGQNLPRDVIAALLVGQDVLAGKSKAKTTTSQKSTVARGKPTGARSDTPKGSNTASSRLRARLENQQI